MAQGGNSFPRSCYFFPGPIYPLKTQLEHSVDRLTAALRAKPDWRHKCKDAAIVIKWRKEAKAQGVQEDTFEYAMQVQNVCQLWHWSTKKCT